MTEKEFRAKERRSGAEKSVKKRKKKKGIKVLFTVLLLLAVMLVAAISVVAYNVFKIETISVVGNTVYDSAKIIETAELEIGDSLLFIGEKKLSEKLSAELPYISEIKIKRELPTGLTINVTETYEEQFFYRNSVFYSADKNGKILNQYYEKNENLPVTIATEDDKIETGYDYLAANEMQANLQKEISAFAKQNNINVIRVGLHDEADLKENYIAGAYHSALGELIMSEQMFINVLKLIDDKNIKAATISVNPKYLSQMLGQKRKNIVKFKELGIDIEVKTDEKIVGKNIKLLNVSIA